MTGPALTLGWARSSNGSSRRRTDFADPWGEVSGLKVQTPAPRVEQVIEGVWPAEEGYTAVEG